MYMADFVSHAYVGTWISRNVNGMQYVEDELCDINASII